jgi:hypothetical protein
LIGEIASDDAGRATVQPPVRSSHDAEPGAPKPKRRSKSSNRASRRRRQPPNRSKISKRHSASVSRPKSTWSSFDRRVCARR